MNLYEDIAMGSFLTSYPDDVSFDEALAALYHTENDCLHNEDCEICALREAMYLWEPFEYHGYSYVAEQIENLKNTLERNFIPKNLLTTES